MTKSEGRKQTLAEEASLRISCFGFISGLTAAACARPLKAIIGDGLDVMEIAWGEVEWRMCGHGGNDGVG
jgi:hypothetical protein